MLHIEVRKSFSGFTLDVNARGSGRRLGVVGPSGCGKTTLLDCIAGIQSPDHGRILVSQRAYFDSSDARSWIPPSQRRVGYVLQESLLFPHMTVQRNLLYGGRGDTPGAMLDEIVTRLELEPLLQRNASSLSGGEARRVAIGRALLSSPALLLLDEPLTGLDGRLAGRTMHYLKEVFHRDGMLAVYVSHSMSDVAFLCDEVLIMDAGRVVASGPPLDVIGRVSCLGERGLADLRNWFEARPRETTALPMPCYDVGGQAVFTGNSSRSPGGVSLLSIRASDIILARARPPQISARNVLHGVVKSVRMIEQACLVIVDAGEDWLVEVTSAAVEDLGLTGGVEVYVIVKASSILVL